MELVKEKLADIYRRMMLIRAFDEEGRKRVMAGEVYGEVHQYVGEEGVAVGICAALEPQDVITSNHRGHGHIIAKGGDVRRMMAELFGKADGYCGGKGGSQHITDVSLGIYGANGITGAGTPIAAGAALASVVKKTGAVAASFFGDGSSNQGIVHEAMNLASAFKLPVLFVIENNGYAVTFSSKESCGTPELAARGAGYGMPGVAVDGMDVLAVYRVAREAANRARRREGPTLIEAKTYRYYGHHSGEEMFMGKRRYRSEEEVAEWRSKDPIGRLHHYLVSNGIMEEAELAAIDQEVALTMKEAVEHARRAPEPMVESALEDYYTVSYPGLVQKGW